MSDAVCKGVKFVGADGVEITVPLASNKNGEVVLTRDGFLKLVRGGLIVPSTAPATTGTGKLYYEPTGESLKVYEDTVALTVPATRELFTDGGLYYFDNASGKFKIQTAKQRIEAELLTTSGDILYRDGSGAARLPKGTDGHILTLASGFPSWAAAAAGGAQAEAVDMGTVGSSTATGTLSFAPSLILVIHGNGTRFGFGWAAVENASSGVNSSRTFDSSGNVGHDQSYPAHLWDGATQRQWGITTATPWTTAGVTLARVSGSNSLSNCWIIAFA